MAFLSYGEIESSNEVADFEAILPRNWMHIYFGVKDQYFIKYIQSYLWLNNQNSNSYFLNQVYVKM